LVLGEAWWGAGRLHDPPPTSSSIIRHHHWTYLLGVGVGEGDLGQDDDGWRVHRARIGCHASNLPGEIGA
jgi:hypothetical protein